MAQHLSNFFCVKFQCEPFKARIPSWCGSKDTKSGLGLFMITLIKTKNWDSSLWKNFPCLHRGIFLYPTPMWDFTSPLNFPHRFPVSRHSFSQPPFSFSTRMCSLCSTLSPPPGSSGFFHLGPLNSWESSETHPSSFTWVSQHNWRK